MKKFINIVSIFILSRLFVSCEINSNDMEFDAIYNYYKIDNSNSILTITTGKSIYQSSQTILAVIENHSKDTFGYYTCNCLVSPQFSGVEKKINTSWKSVYSPICLAMYPICYGAVMPKNKYYDSIPIKLFYCNSTTITYRLRYSIRHDNIWKDFYSNNFEVFP